MKDVLIIDFYDSFTHNIACVLNELEIDSDVVAFDKLTDDHKNYKAYILGPGPGHPNDYQSLNTFISDILIDKSKFLMGICLGHQLILSLFGAEIKKLETPLHGESIILDVHTL